MYSISIAAVYRPRAISAPHSLSRHYAFCILQCNLKLNFEQAKFCSVLMPAKLKGKLESSRFIVLFFISKSRVFRRTSFFCLSVNFNDIEINRMHFDSIRHLAWVDTTFSTGRIKWLCALCFEKHKSCWINCFLAKQRATKLNYASLFSYTFIKELDFVCKIILTFCTQIAWADEDYDCTCKHQKLYYRIYSWERSYLKHWWAATLYIKSM